jgi:hypothetical protein
LNLIKICPYAGRADVHLTPEEAGLGVAIRRLGERVAPANCPPVKSWWRQSALPHQD